MCKETKAKEVLKICSETWLNSSFRVVNALISFCWTGFLPRCSLFHFAEFYAQISCNDVMSFGCNIKYETCSCIVYACCEQSCVGCRWHDDSDLCAYCSFVNSVTHILSHMVGLVRHGSARVKSDTAVYTADGFSLVQRSPRQWRNCRSFTDCCQAGGDFNPVKRAEGSGDRCVFWRKMLRKDAGACRAEEVSGNSGEACFITSHLWS